MIATIIGRVTGVIVDCVVSLFGLMYSWKRWFEGDIIDWHFDEKVHFFVFSRMLSFRSSTVEPQKFSVVNLAFLRFICQWHAHSILLWSVIRKRYVRKQKKRSVNFELGNETEKDVLRRFGESDSPWVVDPQSFGRPDPKSSLNSQENFLPVRMSKR